ncbi:MAG TPA: flagellar motor protein MotB [Polyangiaceae bacterium]|jgi:chemotaxis protein MotB|nr:flagellar motor protein MotB [Polyangiaceae bacterium]
MKRILSSARSRAWSAGVMVAGLVVLAGCGVSKSDYDAKVQEANAAKQDADNAKQQLAQLQSQMANGDQQVAQLKSALGIAQAAAMTDDQKNELDEAKKAVQEAQERAKLLDDLQAKFKKMIDAGHLKVTTRHGRIVLQLHNDVLFATGDAEVKPDGKTAVGEIAATLRSVSLKRFQVAGHTDSLPITTDTKKTYPTNWELSTARAIAVVKLLVTDGVEPGVLSAAGYGPYDPVASNGTPDGQSKNRRIEITLVPNVAPLVAAVDKK